MRVIIRLLNSHLNSHIRSHHSRARDHQHRASSPGRIAKKLQALYFTGTGALRTRSPTAPKRKGRRFAQYLQGENALSRITQSTLFAAAVFILCGEARSAAVAQAPTSRSEFAS
jgi:hypothetical protein